MFEDIGLQPRKMAKIDGKIINKKIRSPLREMHYYFFSYLRMQKPIRKISKLRYGVFLLDFSHLLHFPPKCETKVIHLEYFRGDQANFQCPKSD